MLTLAALVATGALGMAGPAAPAEVLGPERAAILDAARGPAETTLTRPVKLKVHRLAREGRWAFVLAAMQAPDGSPISYEGTPKAEAARAGLVSKDYAALLSHSDAGWSVVVQAVGPTDAAWADLAQTYGAPAELIGGAAR